MTKMRRLLAVIAFLGLAIYVSSALQGQPGKKPAGTGTTSQLNPARAVSNLAEATESRFGLAGVQTYQPVQGSAYFALQVQPKLAPTAVRPRDILIMMSTAATQGGASWIAGYQIADGIIQTANEGDRIALMTVNEPKFTINLTNDEFLLAKDDAEGKRLRFALSKYKTTNYPAGDTDLKTALEKAIASFDKNKERQRIILFLGDGLSTHNPMTEADRVKLARKMAEQHIGFFPVPLGINLNPMTLHGLANATGGVVLRTRVEEEKLTEALKRYETAFVGSVLYNAELQVPEGVIDIRPGKLPPLRSDTPTLVVGRMKAVPKEISYTLTGRVSGSKVETTVTAKEAVLPANLDNFFLVNMIDQWAKAKDSTAVLRADRALTFAYEQTRLQHMEILESAQLALEDGKFEAAGRLYHQLKVMSPHDGEADAGIDIVERLKDGRINKDMLRKKFNDRSKKVDRLELKDGKAQWVKFEFQDDKIPQPKVDPKQGAGIAPENLLKEHRDRQAIEEQKVNQMVEDAVRQANRNLKADPDGTIDMLRNLLNRVKDHPDLGAAMRDGLTNRLQTSLFDTATQVKTDKLRRKEQANAAATAQQNLTREQERKSFEDRLDAQFRIFKNQMGQARFEEKTKYDMMAAMVQIQNEARLKGYNVPVSSKAIYDITSAAHPLEMHNTLVRRREEGWLTIMMGIEKSHVPFPDEPHIHFPPLATWKALIKARKDKYDVFSLPDDEQGRKESSEIYRLLQQQVDTKGLTEKIKLKTALEYFSEKFGGKLPILVDKEAFTQDQPDAPDPYEEEIVLPPAPTKMQMNTALRLVLAQVGKGNATYMIRRNFIEITTSKRYLEDKVIRVYPVGDLAMPIKGGMQMMGGMGGGMMGMGGMGGGMMGMGGMGGGMMGMGGGMMGMGGGMMGMGGMGMPMGGGMMGGMGMPMGGGMMGMGMPMGGGMMGGMGMPMGGGMMGGMGMPMGGGMMGMGMPMGGGMMGGMGMPMGGGMMGMGMPMGGGMMGMGMPMGGGMGMGMGGMPMGGGGSFQGAFNGSLGAMGATQAMGLISLITRIVDPGNWNQPAQLQPFMMGGGMMGFMGFMGGMGFPGGMMGGMMMGGGMMVGAGPPPDPNINVDPQTANSIDFFPPALAIIVRAPSRMHTSITGGIVGGRAKRLEPAAMLEVERKGLAQFKKENPGVIVREKDLDAVKVAQAKKREALDPAKVWEDALAKGGVGVGHVIATADFLFESGEFKHAAEFLKANLRHGIVVRPWVFEALAVALETSGGDKDEIRRARLSGIALDPNDAQGFMSAARAMADQGHHERAIAFCKQAAQLEPNDFHPYEIALAYAETAKDAGAMEWAVGNLVAQDWPVDNLFIQRNAQKRLLSLAGTLKIEKRGAEATRLETALRRLNQRDLIVELKWENAGGPAELEMKVKEPSGSVSNLDQKQTPGGGIMIGYNLTDKEPNCQYIAAEAFSGEYEINITRIYGTPLGNRARLFITQNAGTDKQVRRIEIVRLDQNVPIKISLKDGRRTELASVSAAANQRKAGVVERETSAFYDLRAMANPNFYGAQGPRGGAGTPGIMPSAMAAKDSKNKGPSTPIMQNALQSQSGVQMTAQVRLNPDQRNYDVVIRPFFDAAARNRGANLSVIPGGGN